jgi:hypothetical protein
MNRFSAISAFLLMFLVLALCAQPAVADTLTITGVAGYISGGVYTYQYNFTVNRNPNISLMCDDFVNEVSVPETWTANVTSITTAGTSSPGGLFAGQSYGTYTSQQVYNAAGLIYLGALGLGPLGQGPLAYPGITNLSTGLANWAVWNLLDPSAASSDPYATLDPTFIADIKSLDTAALGVTSAASHLSGVYVYTPSSGSLLTSGEPQEFIGYAVPEPEIAGLLGFGLTSLWALRRRIAL